METTQIIQQKTKKINLPKHTKAGESGNKSRLEFTFLDDKGNCLCDLHYCKDFWNEIFYAAKYNIVPYPVYQWFTVMDDIKKLDYPNKPINLLLVNSIDPDFLNEKVLEAELMNTIVFLNEIEKANSWQLTTSGSIELLDNGRLGILINVSVDWFMYPYLISLLGLIVRNFRQYDGKGIINYLDNLKEGTDYKQPERLVIRGGNFKALFEKLLTGTVKHIPFKEITTDYDCSTVTSDDIESWNNWGHLNKHTDEEITKYEFLNKMNGFWRDIHNNSGVQSNLTILNKV